MHTSRYKRLRALLAQARKDRGLSQNQLAQRLGWVQTAISKVEQGERRLDVVELLDLCAALEIDPKELIRDLLSTGQKDR